MWGAMYRRADSEWDAPCDHTSRDALCLQLAPLVRSYSTAFAAHSVRRQWSGLLFRFCLGFGVRQLPCNALSQLLQPSTITIVITSCRARLRCAVPASCILQSPIPYGCAPPCSSLIACMQQHARTHAHTELPLHHRRHYICQTASETDRLCSCQDHSCCPKSWGLPQQPWSPSFPRPESVLFDLLPPILPRFAPRVQRPPLVHGAAALTSSPAPLPLSVAEPHVFSCAPAVRISPHGAQGLGRWTSHEGIDSNEGSDSSSWEVMKLAEGCC